MQLDPTAAAAGTRLLALDSIDSTNAEALRLARRGERGPLWVTARSQTAGRGRRGRAWVSEPGNLYASLLLADPAPSERLPELSLVAALAVHDAAAGRIPGLAGRMVLKWPNDLLIDRNKFAGILVEGEGARVAIGVGVNCVRHPAHTEFPATDLATAGVRTSAESLFALLSASMMLRLSQWDRGAGFAAIRTDWLSRAAGIGKPIRVKSGVADVSGVFEGIDAAGRLVLRLPDGTTQTVAAGDVLMTAR